MVVLELIGGLISCISPYFLVIIFGWYFSYLKVLEKQSLNPLSKAVIMVTLPVYYFLLIGRSNSIYRLQNYYIIIISDLVKISVSLVFSFTYVYFFKMDSRYKYSWIAINSFHDIRQLSLSFSNTFCYHLPSKSPEEEKFCAVDDANSCINLFFNQLIVWYIMFNLIRKDKKNNIAINKVWEDVAIKNIEKLDTQKDNSVRERGMINKEQNDKENQKEKDEIILQFQAHETRRMNELYATESFSDKVNDYYEKKVNLVKKTTLHNLIYTFLQPPIIAIFCGFILGLMPFLQEWWFNKKTAVFMFQDTLNSIGNSHIVCSYLLLGINLYLNEKGPYMVRFTKYEYAVHLIYKCILLPFIGLIFITIAKTYYENRALLFAAYMQWFLPTSQDIMMICQSKKISSYSISLCLLIQYTYLTVINNFVIIPPLIKILGQN